MSRSDSVIIERLRCNGEVALAAYFAEIRPKLRKFVDGRIMTQLAVRVDASDVLQEAYLQARRQLPAFLQAPHLSAYGWIKRICRQCLVRTYQFNIGTAKRSINREEPAEEVFRSNEQLADIRHPRIQITPSSLVRRRERTDQMREAISQLKAEDGEIIRLVHEEDLSLGEAADKIGIAYDAVKKRYQRAIKRLRQKLTGVGISNE